MKKEFCSLKFRRKYLHFWGNLICRREGERKIRKYSNCRNFCRYNGDRLKKGKNWWEKKNLIKRLIINANIDNEWTWRIKSLNGHVHGRIDTEKDWEIGNQTLIIFKIVRVRLLVILINISFCKCIIR